MFRHHVGSLLLAVDVDQIPVQVPSLTESFVELKVCQDKSETNILATLQQLVVYSMHAKIQAGEMKGLEKELLELLAIQAKESKSKSSAFPLLILKYFMNGVPLPLLRRLFQASVLNDYCSSQMRKGSLTHSVLDSQKRIANVLVQYFFERVHNVIFTYPSSMKQLCWFVERSLLIKWSPKQFYSNSSQPRSRVLLDRRKLRKKHAGASRTTCMNPMCMRKLRTFGGASKISSCITIQRDLRKLPVAIDILPPPHIIVSTQHPKIPFYNICVGCKDVPLSIFTNLQVPLGYKYCHNCECFHRLQKFGIDPSCSRLSSSTPLFSERHLLHRAIEIPSQCVASRKFHNSVSWCENSARLAPQSYLSPAEILDQTTTLGPYSDPKHSHVDSDRFVFEKGRLWKTHERDHIDNKISTRAATTFSKKHSNSDTLAQCIVTEFLLAPEILNQSDTICMVDSPGQRALAALLKAFVSNAIKDRKQQISETSSDLETSQLHKKKTLPKELIACTVANDRKNNIPTEHGSQDNVAGQGSNTFEQGDPFRYLVSRPHIRNQTSLTNDICSWAASPTHSQRNEAMRTYFQNQRMSDFYEMQTSTKRARISHDHQPK